MVALACAVIVGGCAPKPPAQSTEKFGLAETERRAIIKDLLSCEDAGNNADFCDPKVEKQYGVTHETLVEIKLVAIEKKWPMD